MDKAMDRAMAGDCPACKKPVDGLTGGVDGPRGMTYHAECLNGSGTYACPVCGVDTPHWHDTDAVNRLRVIEAVVRPAFEKRYAELAQHMEAIRVNGYGWGFQRRQERKERDPALPSHVIPGWNDRWDTDGHHPAVGEYKNPTVEGLWLLWMSAWTAAQHSIDQQLRYVVSASPSGERKQ